MITADLEPIPLAATIILMREVPQGAPEILMLERAATMAFAPGALVFPGGRVEEQDFEIAERIGQDHEREEIARRTAAIRETIEEAGIAVGLQPSPNDAALGALRNALLEGRGFAAALASAELALDPAALTAFARWRPIGTVVRKFDTRFYLAAAPSGAIGIADGGENVNALWSTAKALLEDAELGRHQVIFPTWCTLHRLAQFDSIAAARADAALYSHHLAAGRIEQRDGAKWLCVEENIGYPVTAQRVNETRPNRG